MNDHEMNRKAAITLDVWDPLNQGRGTYPNAIVNVLTSLERCDHPVDLAKNIRDIYQQEYQVWIPIEDCIQISYKLLAVKFKAKSIV